MAISECRHSVMRCRRVGVEAVRTMSSDTEAEKPSCRRYVANRWYHVRSLLEAVEGSLQKTHMIGASGVNKARRLMTVDGLLQVAVKKGVLHIQLVDRPATRGGDAEDDMNRRRLDNGAKGLIVVDVVALSEATNDPASLVTGKRTVGVEFMLINPLASHNVHARWS